MPTPASQPVSTVARAVIVALLTVRVIAALVVVPDVTADAQGYEAAAYRLAATGSFAYPLMTDAYWETTADGTLRVTPQGRETLKTAPRNAYTMPGYPMLRAAVIAVAPDQDASRAITRVLQALMSVGVAWFVYLLARRYGERVGVIALVTAAVYPPFTLANSYLLTEVTAMFLLTASAYLFVRWSDDLDWRYAASAGLVFGLSLLVRPTMAPWAPIAALIVIASSRGRYGKAITQSLIVAAMMLCLLVPWWARNYEVYDRLVPVSTSGAVTSLEAIRMDTEVKPAWPWQNQAPEPTAAEQRIADLVQSIYDRKPTTSTDDIALRDYYAQERAALDSEMAQQGLAAPWLKARLRSIGTSTVWPNAVSPTAMSGIPFTIAWMMHALILLGFAVGVFLAPRRVDTWLLISAPAFSFAIHAFIIPFQRYHFPVMPFVIVIAAIAFERLWAMWRDGSASRLQDGD